MLDWPVYTLDNDGWLVDDMGNACPSQLLPFHEYTPSEAEKWLAENDLRGSVRGSSFKLPQSRDQKGR